MKPFTVGERVKHHDGRPARIICVDKKGFTGPVVALVTGEDGNEFCVFARADGTDWRDGKEKVLIREPVVEKKYRRVYTDTRTGYRENTHTGVWDNLPAPAETQIGHIEYIYHDGVCVDVNFVRYEKT